MNVELLSQACFRGNPENELIAPPKAILQSQSKIKTVIFISKCFIFLLTNIIFLSENKTSMFQKPLFFVRLSWLTGKLWRLGRFVLNKLLFIGTLHRQKKTAITLSFYLGRSLFFVGCLFVKERFVIELSLGKNSCYWISNPTEE